METNIHYNSVFILFSIIIACAASYTSLEISRKVTFKTGLKSKLWLFAGSVIMGFGIWAMQFVGMMAFYRLFTGSLIMGVSISSMHFIGMDSISRVIIVYDPFLITGSVLAAIAVAFFP
ncbi:hypothetical protein B4144_1420 [Bacillus atrophaeus]|nr:MHYT domain-containing protein [Bacillus atrophaeus]KYD04819.1 hypothetical protein B4144_1420 [Bacillus atrophaeus]